MTTVTGDLLLFAAGFLAGGGVVALIVFFVPRRHEVRHLHNFFHAHRFDVKFTPPADSDGESWKRGGC